jgi:hypothetical protein
MPRTTFQNSNAGRPESRARPLVLERIASRIAMYSNLGKMARIADRIAAYGNRVRAGWFVHRELLPLKVGGVVPDWPPAHKGSELGTYSDLTSVVEQLPQDHPYSYRQPDDLGRRPPIPGDRALMGAP